MIWSHDRYVDWFDGYHASDAAYQVTVAVASRNDVADLAEDLHTEWRLSVRTSVDRLRSRGRSLPVWMVDDEAATRYAVRHLTNDALDLGRTKVRASSAFHSLSVSSHSHDVIDVDDQSSEQTPRSESSGPLESMARELGVMLEAGVGGCPGCTSVQTVTICMGVVERLRFPGELEVVPGADLLTVQGREEPPEGTDWRSSVSEILPELAPSSGPAPGRMPPDPVLQRGPASRFEQRCGSCAVSLLERLVASHGV